MNEEIERDLLALLVCPLTKEKLVQDGDWLVCNSSTPRRRYPIRDGIPVLLSDEAEELEHI